MLKQELVALACIDFNIEKYLKTIHCKRNQLLFLYFLGAIPRRGKASRQGPNQRPRRFNATALTPSRAASRSSAISPSVGTDWADDAARTVTVARASAQLAGLVVASHNWNQTWYDPGAVPVAT